MGNTSNSSSTDAEIIANKQIKQNIKICKNHQREHYNRPILLLGANKLMTKPRYRWSTMRSWDKWGFLIKDTMLKFKYKRTDFMTLSPANVTKAIDQFHPVVQQIVCVIDLAGIALPGAAGFGKLILGYSGVDNVPCDIISLIESYVGVDEIINLETIKKRLDLFKSITIRGRLPTILLLNVTDVNRTQSGYDALLNPNIKTPSGLNGLKVIFASLFDYISFDDLNAFIIDFNSVKFRKVGFIIGNPKSSKDIDKIFHHIIHLNRHLWLDIKLHGYLP